MLAIRTAEREDLEHVRTAYEAWGYRGGVSETDTVYLAEQNSELVGIVRRTHEHGITMLRGMQVAPSHQRQGIGSKLLAAFVLGLPDVECYCVPYAHLLEFYGRRGFAPASEAAAPSFLQTRLGEYRKRGLSVLLMRRPAANPAAPES